MQQHHVARSTRADITSSCIRTRAHGLALAGGDQQRDAKQLHRSKQSNQLHYHGLARISRSFRFACVHAVAHSVRSSPGVTHGHAQCDPRAHTVILALAPPFHGHGERPMEWSDGARPHQQLASFGRSPALAGRWDVRPSNPSELAKLCEGHHQPLVVVRPLAPRPSVASSGRRPPFALFT